MTCKEAQAKVGAYIDGELDASERRIVEAHIESCAECTRTAGELQSIDRLTAREEPPEVSREEWALLFGKISKAREAGTRMAPFREADGESWWEEARERYPFARSGAALSLAAAAAILLLGFLAWVLVSPETSLPGTRTDIAVESPETPRSPETAGTETPRTDAARKKTEDYAEHISGPEPEIDVDPEDGTTHLKYSDF